MMTSTGGSDRGGAVCVLRLAIFFERVAAGLS